MAWVHKEVIDQVRADLKVLNKEYGMKTSVRGLNSLSLDVVITEGKLDFLKQQQALEAGRGVSEENMTTKLTGYTVNHYWMHETIYSGKEKEYLEKLVAIVMKQHWDKSDIQSDYFHCSFYVNICIGRWNKPYVCKGE